METGEDVRSKGDTNITLPTTLADVILWWPVPAKAKFIDIFGTIDVIDRPGLGGYSHRLANVIPRANISPMLAPEGEV